MLEQQLKGELYYRMAQTFLEKLLETGMISKDEYKEIDCLNATSFHVNLQIMNPAF